jgi:hypothetical protein
MYIYIITKKKIEHYIHYCKMHALKHEPIYYIINFSTKKNIFQSSSLILIKGLFYFIFVLGSVSLTKIDAIV